MKYLSSEPFSVPIKNNLVSSKPSCETCIYYQKKDFMSKYLCGKCINWNKYRHHKTLLFVRIKQFIESILIETFIR